MPSIEGPTLGTTIRFSRALGVRWLLWPALNPALVSAMVVVLTAANSMLGTGVRRRTLSVVSFGVVAMTVTVMIAASLGVWASMAVDAAVR